MTSSTARSTSTSSRPPIASSKAVSLRSLWAGSAVPSRFFTYDPVAAFTELPVTPSTWHTLDIPPTTARYVKVLITKMRRNSGGKYRAEVAEIEVYEAAAESTWT